MSDLVVACPSQSTQMWLFHLLELLISFTPSLCVVIFVFHVKNLVHPKLVCYRLTNFSRASVVLVRLPVVPEYFAFLNYDDCVQDENALIWYSGEEEERLWLSTVSRIIPGQRTVSASLILLPFRMYMLFCS